MQEIFKSTTYLLFIMLLRKFAHRLFLSGEAVLYGAMVFPRILWCNSIQIAPQTHLHLNYNGLHVGLQGVEAPRVLKWNGSISRMIQNYHDSIKLLTRELSFGNSLNKSPSEKYKILDQYFVLEAWETSVGVLADKNSENLHRFGLKSRCDNKIVAFKYEESSKDTMGRS